MDLRALMTRTKALLVRAAHVQADVEETFQAAIARHQQGMLADAERGYNDVLARQDDHFGALNFLDILAYHANQPQRSVDLLSRALSIDASQAATLSNLVLALNAVGRGRDAVEACERAIALDPACIEAHSNRGNSLWGLGRREEALASYARALAIEHRWWGRGVAL